MEIYVVAGAKCERDKGITKIRVNLYDKDEKNTKTASNKPPNISQFSAFKYYKMTLFVC